LRKNAHVTFNVSIGVLSVATVRTHRRNIFRKLNLRTQTGVVRFALRSGLLSLRAFIGHQ